MQRLSGSLIGNLSHTIHHCCYLFRSLFVLLSPLDNSYHRALYLSRSSDDFIQTFPCQVHQIGSFHHLLNAQIHCCCHFHGGLLGFGYQLFNLGGSSSRLTGEGTDFVCHHRKTFPVLPCSRSFNCCIESHHVGLGSQISNQPHCFGDFIGGFAQLLNLLIGLGNSFPNQLNPLYRLVHSFIPRLYGAVRLLEGIFHQLSIGDGCFSRINHLLDFT